MVFVDNFWDGTKLPVLSQIQSRDWAGFPRVNCLVYPTNDDGILRWNGDNNCKKTTINAICKKKIGGIPTAKCFIVLQQF